MSACNSCGASGRGAAARGVRGAGGGFRVSVDLSRYYPAASVRARCWLWVPAAGQRRVRWLAARLRRLFALHGQLALATAGHLLPDDEPLALLRPHDTLQVIPLEEETCEAAKTDNVNAGDGRETNKDTSDASEIDSGDAIDPRAAAKFGSHPGRGCDAGDANEISRLKRQALAMLASYEPGARPQLVAGCGRRARRRRASPARVPRGPPHALRMRLKRRTTSPVPDYVHSHASRRYFSPIEYK